MRVPSGLPAKFNFKKIIFLGLALLPARVSWADISVNPQTGGAMSSYEFGVPSWYGLEPSLGLSYSGQGNGLVGAGWQLQAGSSVVRSSKKGTLPRFDSSDLYALDGQELVGCSTVAPWSDVGNSHCLKVNNTLKIVFNSSQNKWFVTRTDGVKLTYVPVLKINSGGGLQTVRWGLNSVQDLLGHTVTYSYFCDNGSALTGMPANGCSGNQTVYLKEVNYGDGLYRAKMLYETGRPDVISYATGTGLGKIRYRVQAVATYQRKVGEPYKIDKVYRLHYVASRNSTRTLLSHVQVLGRNTKITEDQAGVDPPQD